MSIVFPCGGDPAATAGGRPALVPARLRRGLYLRCVVKSGGFGDADALARLLPT